MRVSRPLPGPIKTSYSLGSGSFLCGVSVTHCTQGESTGGVVSPTSPARYVLPHPSPGELGTANRIREEYFISVYLRIGKAVGLKFFMDTLNFGTGYETPPPPCFLC